VVSPWHVGARLPDDGELRAELTALADDDASPVDAAEVAAATGLDRAALDTLAGRLAARPGSSA
jgi:hypothetical protein